MRERPGKSRFWLGIALSVVLSPTRSGLAQTGGEIHTGAANDSDDFLLSASFAPESDIRVDGDASEWELLPALPPDGDDPVREGQTVDWRGLSLAHDEHRVFLTYENDGPIRLNSAFNVFFDTDDNRSHGFRGPRNDFPIGSEYLLQGATLLEYTGEGMDWSWRQLGMVEYAVGEGVAEFSFPKSWIRSPTRLHVFAWADDGGRPDMRDVYPDHAVARGGGGPYFTILLDRVFDEVVSNPDVPVSLDGNLDDWLEVRDFPSDSDDVSGSGNLLDWRQVYVGHRGDNLYIAYENDGPITLNAAFNVYIDSDLNRRTGYQSLFPIGADYLLQSTALLEYSGDGLSWDWTLVGYAFYATYESVAEFAFPLRWIDDTHRFDFFLLGENSIYPDGSVRDAYPDDAMGRDRRGSFFSYRLKP